MWRQGSTSPSALRPGRLEELAPCARPATSGLLAGPLLGPFSSDSGFATKALTGSASEKGVRAWRTTTRRVHEKGPACFTTHKQAWSAWFIEPGFLFSPMEK